MLSFYFVNCYVLFYLTVTQNMKEWHNCAYVTQNLSDISCALFQGWEILIGIRFKFVSTYIFLFQINSIRWVF